MFLLVREISPYTSHCVLLGCFTTRENAETARLQYVTPYQENPQADPWKDQAYCVVDLERDVRILDGVREDGDFSNCAAVYVVSVFSEAFGQIIRDFRRICSSLTLAQQAVQEIAAEPKDSFPEYSQIQKAALNELLSDEETDPYHDLL
jgi:hypothetical protein